MLAELLAWYNIIFLAAVLVAVLFTCLTLVAIGGSHDVDADAGVDADADLEADVDADLDVDADVDVGVDGDVDIDPDADVEIDVHADVDADLHAHTGLDVDAQADADVEVAHIEPGAILSLLGFFGLGKAPLTMLIVLFGYSFGLSGYVANRALIEDAEQAGTYYPVSLGIAVVVGLSSLRLGSRLLARYLPTLATSVVRMQKLVGTKGEASLPINERAGEVQVYDRYGTLHNLSCRVRAGRSPVPKGAEVILLSYVSKEEFYYVAQSRSSAKA